jgi:hypothetical protein
MARMREREEEFPLANRLLSHLHRNSKDLTPGCSISERRKINDGAGWRPRPPGFWSRLLNRFR